MASEDINKLRADVSDGINDIATKVFNLIDAKSKELNLNDRNRWLMGSRVANLLWVMHHKIVFHAATVDDMTQGVTAVDTSQGNGNG